MTGTAVRLHDLPTGAELVLAGRSLRPGTVLESTSRYAQDTWRLEPAVLQPHVQSVALTFGTVPARYREHAKQLCYAMLSGPLPVGEKRQSVVGIRGLFSALRKFLHWLDSRPTAPIGRTAVIGAVAVAVYPLAFYTAMAQAGVATGTVITVGSSPVFAAVLERWLDRTPLNTRWSVATVLAAIGVTLVVTGHSGPEGQPRSSSEIVAGVSLGLAAGAAYATYSYAASRLMQRGGRTRPVMGLIFGGGAVLLLPVLLATAGPLVSTRSGILVIAYLAIVPMALAYLLFGTGLAHVGASTTATLILVEPVAAALLSVVVVGEHLSVLGWAGIGLVCCGLLVLGTRSAGHEHHPTRAPATQPQ